MILYVGNISASTPQDRLKEIFEKYGAVTSVTFVMDRETGRFRHFGFVEINGPDADAAIAGIDGTELDGREIHVMPAHPDGMERYACGKDDPQSPTWGEDNEE